LRYFNASGADAGGEIGELHHPETHLIPLALAAADANGPALQVHGSDYLTADGTCIRDYIHVNDLADAHVLALQHLERSMRVGAENSLAVNLGTGHGYSVLEIIRAVESATGRTVRRSMERRRPGDPLILVADPSKARSVLGWTAKRDLADIVGSAWAWMQVSKSLPELVA
jgi:UDP-arabinose 4-epimerase